MKYPSSHTAAKALEGKTVTILRDLSPMFQKGMIADIVNAFTNAADIRRGRARWSVHWEEIELAEPPPPMTDSQFEALRKAVRKGECSWMVELDGQMVEVVKELIEEIDRLRILLPTEEL